MPPRTQGLSKFKNRRDIRRDSQIPVKIVVSSCFKTLILLHENKAVEEELEEFIGRQEKASRSSLSW